MGTACAGAERSELTEVGSVGAVAVAVAAAAVVALPVVVLDGEEPPFCSCSESNRFFSKATRA